MAVQVTLEDHNGNMLYQAKLAESAAVARLLPALVTRLHLPSNDEAGRPINYHLSYNRRRLTEDETLESAQVQAGSTIVVIPEFTAGGQPEPQEYWELLGGRESTTMRSQPSASFVSGYDAGLYGLGCFCMSEWRDAALRLIVTQK
jgi:hypothetical protein